MAEASVSDIRIYAGQETTRNTTRIKCASDSCDWNGSHRYDKSRALKHYKKCTVRDPNEERVWVIHQDQKNFMLASKREKFQDFVKTSMSRLSSHLASMNLREVYI